MGVAALRAWQDAAVLRLERDEKTHWRQVSLRSRFTA